jgi:hypothetical protein
VQVRTITLVGFMLSIALAVQLLHLPAFITGPVINAVLLVSAVFVGLSGSIIIGCITPVTAVLTGIVNPVLLLLIPIIMTANTVFVTLFFFLHSKNKYLAVVVAAAAKYLIFYGSLNYVLSLAGIYLPEAIIAAFQIPQIYSALTGGAIGLAICHFLRNLYPSDI